VPLLGIKCRSVRLARSLITTLNEVTRLLLQVHAPFFVTHRRNKDVPGHVKKTRRGVEAEQHTFFPSPVYGCGQHHFPTALPLGNEPLVRIE